MEGSTDAVKILHLHVQDVVYRGRGLARHEGLVCFVPGTLPGECVKAAVVRLHRNYAVARLLEVETPSPGRVPAACPLAASPGLSHPCPGCAYQHAAYDEELRLKQAQLKTLVQHQTGVPDEIFDDPIPSPEALGYRNKVVLHEDGGGNAHVMGYVGEDNRKVIDVTRCPLAVPPINDAILAAREAMARRTRREAAQHTFRYTAHNGVAHWTGRPPPDADWFTEACPLGDIRVPRGSFFQVNPALAERLATRVTDCLSAVGACRVIDLYCGIGLFALCARRAGVEEVVGIDSDPRAIQAARANAGILGIEKGTRFRTAPAGPGLRDVLKDAAQSGSTLIVDPPRLGLDRDVLSAIVTHPPAHMVYVSCAADTLARDLAFLLKSGYRLTSVQLLDMFPRTALFETVVQLRHSH